MLQKKDSFRCRSCGYCCTLIVPLKKDDIEKIKKLGYKEEDFVEVTPFGDRRIRMKNYYCYFLGLHKGETFCRIYEARPKICGDYPFFRDHIGECFPPRLFDDIKFPGENKGRSESKNANRA